jgi:hypothetical protein
MPRAAKTAAAKSGPNFNVAVVTPYDNKGRFDETLYRDLSPSSNRAAPMAWSHSARPASSPRSPWRSGRNRRYYSQVIEASKIPVNLSR